MRGGGSRWERACELVSLELNEAHCKATTYGAFLKHLSDEMKTRQNPKTIPECSHQL